MDVFFFFRKSIKVVNIFFFEVLFCNLLSVCLYWKNSQICQESSTFVIFSYVSLSYAYIFLKLCFK